jgi:hypothetical protein
MEVLLSRKPLDLCPGVSHHARNNPIEIPQLSHSRCSIRVYPETGGRQSHDWAGPLGVVKAPVYNQLKGYLMFLDILARVGSDGIVGGVIGALATYLFTVFAQHRTEKKEQRDMLHSLRVEISNIQNYLKKTAAQPIPLAETVFDTLKLRGVLVKLNPDVIGEIVAFYALCHQVNDAILLRRNSMYSILAAGKELRDLDDDNAMKSIESQKRQAQEKAGKCLELLEHNKR